MEGSTSVRGGTASTAPRQIIRDQYEYSTVSYWSSGVSTGTVRAHDTHRPAIRVRVQYRHYSTILNAFSRIIILQQRSSHAYEYNRQTVNTRTVSYYYKRTTYTQPIAKRVYKDHTTGSAPLQPARHAS